MVTTAQILAEKALRKTCDEQCVEWAIGLLESGHQSIATCRMAAKLRPHNHFELASLRDQILDELKVDCTSNDDAIVMYTFELLSHANDGTIEVDTAIDIVKELYESNGLEPDEIQDFYWLYFARDELKDQGFQYYLPDADRSNIDQITHDRIREFVAEHRNQGK
jgi:hypothetical protein